MPHTGIGIAEDDRQRIYSLFFRPEHAWRIDNAGHGLGLTVVTRCTDLMGASQGLSSREGRRRGNDQRRVFDSPALAQPSRWAIWYCTSRWIRWPCMLC
ncbi:ATP-binding protein [Methylomonas montana]|uniref:ATP-binding protein n=1 Tax=Methylomonas montana TaxID=3058963 RepID=UPI00265AF2ED|nr:ATP-binding protein [Methylomonas montana]WKJ90039.1 ATP-binding protein [Methylomonas montana]